MAMKLSEPLKAEVINLNFYYDTVQALKNVNLSIADKKITALIGPSGAERPLISDASPDARPLPWQPL